MKVTVKDIIDMMSSNITDDTIIIENYTKVVEILDKVNEQQAKTIFNQLIYNHEIAQAWARNFQVKSNLFAKQIKQGGINPMEVQQMEQLQKNTEQLAEKRSELEKTIGKTFFDKGFITKETYNKYYS